MCLASGVDQAEENRYDLKLKPKHCKTFREGEWVHSADETDAEGHEILERSRSGATAQVSAFETLKLKIEAILFAADAPLDAGEMRTLLGDVSLTDVRIGLKDLSRDYEMRAFCIVESGGKYHLKTKTDYANLIKKQYSIKPRTFSKSALETLAIVAYRQPVTRAEVNIIRGVDSSSIVSTLVEHGLILAIGKRKEVGSPLEYRTTPQFLEVFNLPTLKELPSLRSLQMNIDNQKQIAVAVATLDEGPAELITPEELSFPDSVDSDIPDL